MSRKYNIFTLGICFIFLMTGCIKIETPSETMVIPAYTKSDDTLNEFKDMLQKNKPPKELLEFLDNNIQYLHESSADIAVIRVIELQKKQLIKYQEKLLDPVYSTQLIDIQNKNKEVHDIPDPKVRNWAIDLKENGFTLSTEIEIDYARINEIAKSQLSNELKDYIKIESKESSTKYSEMQSLDTGLATKPLGAILSDLAETINTTFEYTSKYKDSPYKVRVNQLKSDYLRIFLFGSPNNSAFKFYQGYGKGKEKNEINPGWKIAYLDIKATFTSKVNSNSSEIGIFISNYSTELEKNKGVLSEELYKYIMKKIKNQES